MRRVFLGLFLSVLASFAGFTPAMADTVKMGIVIMHGKGGSPDKHVDRLARELKKAGYEVANLEMPWSHRREYDVDTAGADAEIDKAIADLRAKGAQKIFVSGHSQGGAFAVHYGATHTVDGVIAIAPGGNVSAPIFQKNLGETIERAEKLVAEGKGDKKTNLRDFESSKGTFSVRTTPKIYLTWFDSNGAMNYRQAVQSMSEKTPVLWLVAERDYKGLRRINPPMFDLLPENPHSKMLEPKSDHIGAPTASIDMIIKWTEEVAASK